MSELRDQIVELEKQQRHFGWEDGWLADQILTLVYEEALKQGWVRYIKVNGSLNPVPVSKSDLGLKE